MSIVLKRCGVDCDEMDGPCAPSGAGPTGPLYEQYDGPFVFPAWAFRDNEPNEGFYKKLAVDGTNAVKYAAIPNDPNLLFCAVPPGGDATGTEHTSWTGDVEYNMAGVPAGSLQLGYTPAGLLPGAGSNRPAGGQITITEGLLSLEDAFGILAVLGGGFCAQYFFSGINDEGYYKRWTSISPDGGYFVSGFLNSIWCPFFSMQAQLSKKINPRDLAIPLARSGYGSTPARTQTLGAYDSGTRTYQGNKSRAVFSKTTHASQTTLFGDVTFLVTPTVGDPYRVTYIHEQAVTPNTSYQVEVEFPWIANATVYLESYQFSGFPSAIETFESFTVGDYRNLEGTLSWIESMEFVSPRPNGDCWDDFEDFLAASTTDNNRLLILNTGYAWADVMRFSMRDAEDTYDDFETYAVATDFYWINGFGWTSMGFSYTYLELYTCDDDLESYSAGAILSLQGGNGPWNGNGVFA